MATKRRASRNITAPCGVDGGMRGGSGIDSTEQKRAEDALQRQLAIEQSLAGASSRLINVSPAELAAIVHVVLADVGRIMQVDRCFVLRLSDDLAFVDTMHEWCAPRIHSRLDDMRNTSTAAFAWMVERMRDGKALGIARTADLPPEAAAERQLLADGHIRSLLLVPIRHAGKLTGLIGAAAVRGERPWSEEDDRFLRTIGELLANAQARCHAERALRQSEERFRALLMASSEVLYRMSPDWSEMRHLQSRSFLANTDRPSRTWLEEYLLPEDQPQVLAAIREAIRAKRVFELEHRVVRADGTVGWTFSRAIPVLDANGEIVEWFGAASDVTKRKSAEVELFRHREHLEELVQERTVRLEKANAALQAEIRERQRVEKTLRESEERLSLAQRAGRVGVFDWDLLSQKVVWTPELEAIFGYEPGSFEGTYEGWAKHLVPEDLRRLEPQFAEWMRSDRANLDWEYRIVRPDAELRWITACGEIIRGRTGRALRIIGTNVDITERKRAEMDLDRIRGILSEGQRIAHVGSFEYLVATGEMVWSDEQFRIYGLEPGPRSPSYAELRQKHFYTDDAERVDTQFAAVLQTGSTLESEHRIVRPDGSVRDLYNLARPYVDASGTLVKYIGVTLDITERKRAEKELAERADAIQLLHDVASMANQARDPKEAIQACLQWLTRHNGWSFGHALLPAGDDPDLLIPAHFCYQGNRARFARFRQATFRMRFRRGEDLPGRVLAHGKPVWIKELRSELLPSRAALAEELGIRTAVAFPVVIGEQVVAVLEVFSDRLHQPEERIVAVMAGVGMQLGRVLERARFEEHLLAIPEEIQRAIAQDLHDDVGQELTGLGLKAKTLAEMLAASQAPAARLAADLSASVDRTRTKVRGLSHRLLPIELKEGLLAVALGQLVAAVNTGSRMACTFACVHPDAVFDTRAATHLYRIAQEAVSNAMRHSGARNIRITLAQDSVETVLRIEDDGAGMANEAVQAGGMGLRIMQYRAGLIGGTLDVGPGSTGGTLVQCKFPPGTRPPVRSRRRT